MSGAVFISHSSRDQKVAQAVCTYLESRGFACWIAPRDITAGEIWASAIMNAINSARSVIVLCSEDSGSSSQVLREVERAAARGLPIIPLRLGSVPLTGAFEYFLSNAHWIDLFPEDLTIYLPAIERAVGVHCEEKPLAPVAVAHEAELVHPDQWTRKTRTSLFSRFSRFMDDKE